MSKAPPFVNIYLEQLFRANEKKQTDRLTDAKILESVQATFPSSAIQSLDDIKRRRHSYNHGVNWWVGKGTAESRGLPLSYEYDENDQRVESDAPESDAPTASNSKRAGIDLDVMKTIAAEGDASVLKTMDRKMGDQMKVVVDTVGKLVDKKLSERPVVELKFGDAAETKRVDTDGKHKAFADVMKRVAAGIPVYLCGPKGSGKTTLASQVAEALGRSFTFNSFSAGVSESQLLGRTLPNAAGHWEYKPSPFVTTFMHGGIHLFDEMDNADANMLVIVNAAIANGLLSVPFKDDPEPIKRHNDTVLMAAANTWGLGADAQYVGRAQLDAATLDRFAMGTVFVDYDPDLEQALIPDKELVDWAHDTRKKCRAARLQRDVSTRNLIDAMRLRTAGLSIDDVKNVFFQTWTADEKGRVQR